MDHPDPTTDHLEWKKIGVITIYQSKSVTKALSLKWLDSYFYDTPKYTFISGDTAKNRCVFGLSLFHFTLVLSPIEPTFTLFKFIFLLHLLLYGFVLFRFLICLKEVKKKGSKDYRIYGKVVLFFCFYNKRQMYLFKEVSISVFLFNLQMEKESLEI